MTDKIACKICGHEYRKAKVEYGQLRSYIYDTDYMIIDGHPVCNGTVGDNQCKKKLLVELYGSDAAQLLPAPPPPPANPKLLEQIILCLIDGTSDDGHPIERIRGWVEYKMGKDAADVFWQIYKKGAEHDRIAYESRDVNDRA